MRADAEKRIHRGDTAMCRREKLNATEKQRQKKKKKKKAEARLNRKMQKNSCAQVKSAKLYN